MLLSQQLILNSPLLLLPNYNMSKNVMSHARRKTVVGLNLLSPLLVWGSTEVAYRNYKLTLKKRCSSRTFRYGYLVTT